MPEYICKLCKKTISFPEKDTEFHRKLGCECPSCYSIIAKERYQRNMESTIFSPMGSALGDMIVRNVVESEYVKNNPSEKVVFTKDINEYYQRLQEERFDKNFFANMFSGGREAMPDGATWFSLMNEVNEYAKKGIYPKWGKFKIVENMQGKQFAVIHARNINKSPEKNMTIYELYSIISLIGNFVDIVLVGNDSTDDGYNKNEIEKIVKPEKEIIDLRNKLELEEIAWLTRACKFFIGKDSGIVHLAAASGCKKIFSWGFQNERWFPKTQKERLFCLIKEDDNIKKVSELIEREIQWYG